MIGHFDPTIALAGINNLIDVFAKRDLSIMQDYADLYIQNVCLQFKVRTWNRVYISIRINFKYFYFSFRWQSASLFEVNDRRLN